MSNLVSNLVSEVVIQRVSAESAPDDESLQAWAQLALRTAQPCGELVIRLVDAQESRAINAQYRNKDKATNVLSFPAQALPAEFLALASGQLDHQSLGDLVICSAVVNAEAQQQDKLESAHWAHMVIHGCLHLQGFDHQLDAQAEQMEALERQLLAELKFSDPY